MRKRPRPFLLFIVSLLVLLPAQAAMAIDTDGMALRSDNLFRQNGMHTKTVCTDERATITMFDSGDGKRPSEDNVIETLAVVGKAFNREFGADYFYKMSVYYGGREWIETLAGNCRDSFQGNTVSRCYYRVIFQ